MYFAYKRGDDYQVLDRNKLVRNHYDSRVWKGTDVAMDRLSYAIGNATPDAIFDFACMLPAPCDGRDWDLEDTDSDSSGSDIPPLWEDNALDGPMDDGDAAWDPTMPETSTETETAHASDVSASAGSNYMPGSHFLGGDDSQAGMSTGEEALSSTPRDPDAPIQVLDELDTPRASGYLQNSSRALEDMFEQALPSGAYQGNEIKGTFEHIEDVNNSGLSGPVENEEDQGVAEHVEDVEIAETEDTNTDNDRDDEDGTNDELNTDPIQRRRVKLQNDAYDVDIYWEAFQRLPPKHPEKQEITGKYLYWANLGAKAAGDFLNRLVSQREEKKPVTPGKSRHKRRPRAFLKNEAPEETQANQAHASPSSAQVRTAQKQTAAEYQRREQFQLAQTRLLVGGRELATQSVRRLEVDMDEQHSARKAKFGVFHTRIGPKYVPESPLRNPVSVDDVRSHTAKWW